MANKAAPADWSTGICDCFSDGSSCCLTFWCPCVTFGRTAEIVDRESNHCCCHGTLFCLLCGFSHFASIYAWLYRTNMRRDYNIDGNLCIDCLLSVFCTHLSLCQMYRELKARGYDPSAGWAGNVHLQSDGATAAPAFEGGMTR